MLTPKGAQQADALKLGFDNFTFHDLYNPFRLKELADIFYQALDQENPALFARFVAYRNSKGEGMKPEDISAVLVEAAPYLSRFVVKLFGVEKDAEALRKKVENEQIIFRIKKEFIQRRAFKKVKEEQAKALNYAELESAVNHIKEHYKFIDWSDEEHGTAQFIAALLEDEKEKKEAMAQTMSVIEQWCVTRYYQRRNEVKHWASYKFPEDMEYEHLVRINFPDPTLPQKMEGPSEHYRRRDGFKLTDGRYNERQVMNEVDYCVFCHERDRDSCSKGYTDKSGKVIKNPLGITLNGCPLDEKISEAHYLKNEGDSIGALSLITLDNPMCAGTGHRICNDCMKACIYQKQEPVNIPQIETHILTDVLNLPYGFEIYALLTRWNPLDVKRPYMLPYNGKDVLVVGLGPAGYTLAHYLLNEGFGVVGVDGLKIEPVFEQYIGDEKNPPMPMKNWSEIYRDLDERVLEGFGGVSEYGITVRWDKNFLTTLHIILARRDHFRMYGGTRFGGTITIEDAWSLGFEHIAIAAGAGKPTIVEMKNNLIRGIRKASDFLMALQLTGSAKGNSLANLQVQLPAVVIGGGLTGIDTATELIAYYPVQVEKFYLRYQTVVKEFGEEAYWSKLDKEEKGIAETFLAHAKEIQAERERAGKAGEKPDLISLVHKWGGVSLVYRKTMTDAPAYRLNHEEIIKAMEEGIYFIECLSPTEAHPDEYGAVKALTFEKQGQNAEGKWRAMGEFVTLNAKSVMVAAGTSPNVIYEREYPGTFKLDQWGQFFQGFRLKENGELEQVGSRELGFFTSYQHEGKYITYYGDNHPIYAGNVVKAMASAREGFPHVAGLFKDAIHAVEEEAAVYPHGNGKDGRKKKEDKWNSLVHKLDDALMPRVHQVNRLTSTITEVVVHAPFAASHFHPGQFFRLQNYETYSAKVDGYPLAMEGLALTGAWVDKEKGLLSMIVLEMGGSSNLCAYLKPGERVVVMGPTGTPTEIPAKETVLLAGGGLGNAVLFSIAKALKANGSNVIYFAGYKKGEDLYKQDEVEEGTDQVIWSTDTGAEIAPRRPQDAHFRGNIVQAMLAYQSGKLAEVKYPLETVKRIIAIGSDRMMAAVKEARHTVLAPYLHEHEGIASINSTMQCMMKEVCAQCLQRHVDPKTGKESFVFSCYNQDQHMDEVDFQNLNSRLKANTVQEKLTVLWMKHLLEKSKLEHV